MKVNPIMKSALIASVDKVLSKTFSNGITLMVRRTTPEKEEKLNTFDHTQTRLMHRFITKVCRILAPPLKHFERKNDPYSVI